MGVGTIWFAVLNKKSMKRYDQRDKAPAKNPGEKGKSGGANVIIGVGPSWARGEKEEESENEKKRKGWSIQRERNLATRARGYQEKKGQSIPIPG